MTSQLKRHEDGTIELTITIPWNTIKSEYEKTLTATLEHVEVKGFRKGKAPRELAEKELDKSKVYEEVIRQLIPQAYEAAVKQNNLKPIMQPDIHLKKAKEGEEWVIAVFTAEKPQFDFSSYKTVIQKAKGELKKDELWIPGKEKPDEKKDSADERKQKQLNTILNAFLKETKIVIPGILVKEEVNRRLSNFLDQLMKLGLTIDTYAKSKGITPDQLRNQYEEEIKNTYKLEFLLEELADAEKIAVEKTEIDAVIEKTTDQKEKEALKKNTYYLANLLRRQKTLDRVLSL